MKQLILKLTKRDDNYRASLWDMDQNKVYGTYTIIDGRVENIAHQQEGYQGEGLASYSPGWVIQAEDCFKTILEIKCREGTLTNSCEWIITVHVDLLQEDMPDDPLTPLVSMYIK